MKQVLITGCSGYNGRSVTVLLNENGYHTVGLDADYYPFCLYDEPASLPAQRIDKDLRDVVASDLEGFDSVVHLAALANDPLGESYPELAMEINRNATIRLAESAKAAGVKKFVFASSTAMYGIQDPDTPVDETMPVSPVTRYAMTKAASEEQLRSLNNGSFRVIIMRNATMHGISPKIRLDIVLNNLVASAHVYKEIKILSDGTPWRPMISVDDFARAVLVLLESSPEHIVYNIGFNDENYRVRELGAIIQELVKVPLSINENKTPEERSYRVSFDRFHNEFAGVTMTHGVRDSVLRLADYYRRCNLTEDDFAGHKYFRVRTIEHHLKNGTLTADLRRP